MYAPTQTSLSAEAIKDVVTMTTATTGAQRLENETSAMQAEHVIVDAIWRAYEPTDLEIATAGEPAADLSTGC